MGQNTCHMRQNTCHMGQNTCHMGQTKCHMGQNTCHMGQNICHMGQNTSHMGQNDQIWTTFKFSYLGEKYKGWEKVFPFLFHYLSINFLYSQNYCVNLVLPP